MSDSQLQSREIDIPNNDARFISKAERLARKHRAGWLTDFAYNRAIDNLLRQTRRGATN